MSKNAKSLGQVIQNKVVEDVTLDYSMEYCEHLKYVSFLLPLLFFLSHLTNYLSSSLLSIP